MHRGELTGFVDRHPVLWEAAMAFLALAYVCIALLIDTGEGVPSAMVLGLGMVLLAEFVARCLDAPSRVHYMKTHWVDLVSALPLVGGLRSVRLLRLARLGAAVRAFSLVERGAEERNVGNGSLWILGPVLFLIWILGAGGYWSFEHGVNASVRNFGDALYWAFTTASTVGYGDITPVTAEGRVIAGILILIGVGMVGLVSARLAQHWAGKSSDRALMDRLNDIDGRLAEMADRLENIVAAGGAATSRPVAPEGDLIDQQEVLSLT